MSINHIIDGIVPDDELLNSHFDVIRCNNIDINTAGGSIVGLDRSYSGSFTATPGITGIIPILTNAQRVGASVWVGYDIVLTIPNPALSQFYVDCPYPDALKAYYDIYPDRVTNFNTMGEAHIAGVQTLDLKGHHFYLEFSAPSPGQETSHVRFGFKSWGDSPATAGNFQLLIKVAHTAFPSLS
jgi:hypothetical protein